MENKIFDTSQDKILASLSIDDYKDIRLPADDFLDDGSASSFSDSENRLEPNDRKKKFILDIIYTKSIVLIIFVKRYWILIAKI